MNEILNSILSVLRNVLTMGGISANPFATLTRPANTSIYQSGDLISNSTTAGDCVALELKAARKVKGSFTLMRIRLHKDSANITAAVFRLHVFNVDPFATAPTNGDNGALELNGLPAGAHLGSFDYDMTAAPDIQASDIELAAVPIIGTTVTVELATGDKIYVLIEARDAYTPASGEKFRATLEDFQD